MKQMPFQKYRPYGQVDLSERLWPSRTIGQAPLWCSVDLRDGNQALTRPMSVREKLEMYRLLVEIGFKEIEVGFPSASQTEFDFVRLLIEDKLVPDDVVIQVLTQARAHLIKRTFEAIEGAKRATVHLYNSTSELQRRVVFRKDRKDIVRLAVEGSRLVHRYAMNTSTNLVYEYSPESFTGTEPDFALEICEAVSEVWQPSAWHKMIINLPATVEMSTPNVYADSVEWFHRHFRNRDCVTLSIHPHNDRGTAVAAAELALLAGAERIEGTLFGNGERTGNADIITLALNMLSQGIDPCLDLHRIETIVELSQRCTKLPVHPRHPYAGELVYTAFSGSHQDAISKGMKYRAETGQEYWEVPYLPIDPEDVGRDYESIVRINSQSGKGGVAYLMEREHRMVLPKKMHAEFAAVIQRLTDECGKEVPTNILWEVFKQEYLDEAGTTLLIKDCEIDTSISSHTAVVRATIVVDGEVRVVKGAGNGPINAFANALFGAGLAFRLHDYSEHALSSGSDSKAVAYVQLEKDGCLLWGVGIDESIDVASLKAVASALDRAIRARRTVNTRGPRSSRVPAIDTSHGVDE